ncbi:MAG: hypothetical protein IJA35_00660 [Clostridia bacterium]|nr:hypothetical protein [Oscillospiraceae bacterium]MBQ3551660.1 hypothetical protein [Clostridia bacterium]
MTVKGLNRFHELKCEITKDKAHLEKLKKKATPRGRQKESLAKQQAAEIADLEAVISLRDEQCRHELEELNKYIESLPDRLTQQICCLRFIEHLNWTQVAQRVGGGNKGDSLRQMLYKHLKRDEKRREGDQICLKK